jgi:SapC
LINQDLHIKPTALDSIEHRALKLQLPITDWSMASKLNAMFVAAAEFGDVSRDFPIVFVKAGKEDDGSDAIAPIALFGLQRQQNLFWDNGSWRARYMPAVLRAYPFCIARVDAERFAICVDMAYSGAVDGANNNGANNSEGQALFEADGKPAELLKNMTQHLETLESEIQRTRLIGKRLLELDLLREMRFDVTLPDGKQHTVDGFLTIDDKKATDLPEAVVVDLHRTGMLGLMHAHWLSLGNMQRLVDWHAARGGSLNPPAA